MKFEELHNDKETNDECLMFIEHSQRILKQMMIQKKHSESYYQFY